jgi:outer membrane lipoprotein
MQTPNPQSGFLVVLLAWLLSACATGPTFDTRGVDPALTPQRVSNSPQAATGKAVQWGGTILGVSNQPERTQIEVLAYPLGSNAKPQTDGDPLGRFILEKSGYLEPAIYAQGRLISVVGTVTGTQAGQVGEASYDYPVVDARQLYLWPEDRDYGAGVHFGVGVGSGGWDGTRWGTGVGIGF